MRILRYRGNSYTSPEPSSEAPRPGALSYRWVKYNIEPNKVVLPAATRSNSRQRAAGRLSWPQLCRHRCGEGEKKRRHRWNPKCHHRNSWWPIIAGVSQSGIVRQVQVMAETTTARALTDSEMMDDNSSERLSRLLLLFRDCCFACKKRKAAPPDGKTA